MPHFVATRACWTPASSNSTKQPAGVPDARSIEAEANRLIKDALKQIPKF